MQHIVTLVAGLSLCAVADAVGTEHPRLYIANGEKAQFLTRIEQTAWAVSAYGKLTERVAPYVERHRDEPDWITSRMLMNWETHYITPIVENDKWVRGEGRAPVPTPRYAGARDWSAEYGLPGVDELKPYNDKNGLIWARGGDGTYKWVHPSKTGHSIEKSNQNIMDLARDAAFVYWLTGSESHAKFAADIFWLYMEGFSHKRLPHSPDGKEVGSKGGPKNIYGSHTFEVIHDNICEGLAVTYDFLYEYLERTGRDVRMCQEQFKRMADRVIAGGGRTGNWNLHQADTIAHIGLVLADDENYADGKGRQHYIAVVLNADTPHQLGLNQVIRTGYDQETGIWPEAFGYGAGVTVSVTMIASLIARQQEGPSVLDDPILTKAALVQFQWLFPNGRSIGLGDSTHGHVQTLPLELLIAHSRRRGDRAREDVLTAALRHEINAGRYNRGNHTGLFELCAFVAELRAPDPAHELVFERVFDGAPLNTYIQRNPAPDARHSLMAAMCGTRGGHTHANGLSLELYGAGEIQGQDPGPGSSYWRPDHGQYYKQRPAHNTVIVNGNAVGGGELIVVGSEPRPGKAGVSPGFAFAEALFRETRPAADLRRCVALIRTSPTSGFYLDIFRSRADAPDNRSHDYVYHNLGQSLQLLDSRNEPIELTASDLLGSDHGDQKGYDYFSQEHSVDCRTDFRALFTTAFPDRTIGNSVWVCGAPGRRVFALAAPKNIRAARGELPASVAALPLPTLLIRQSGEAWDEPFIVLFEPFAEADGGPTVSRVQRLPTTPSGVVAVQISGTLPAAAGGDDFTVTVFNDADGTQPYNSESAMFRGCFGAILRQRGEIRELYLGDGMRISAQDCSLAAVGTRSPGASLRQTATGWIYAAEQPVQVEFATRIDANGLTPKVMIIESLDRTAQELIGQAVLHRSPDDPGSLVVRATLPAGGGHLRFE